MQIWKQVTVASALLLGQWVYAQPPGVTIIEVPRDRQSSPSAKTTPAPAPAQTPARSSSGYSYTPSYATTHRYCTCLADTANRQTLVAVLSSAQFDKLASNIPGQLADAKIESELTETGCTYLVEVTYADHDGEECSIAANIFRRRNSALLSAEYRITKNTCETPVTPVEPK